MAYVNPGRLGLIGAPTYPMLRDATQNSLIEILDANDIPYDLNKAENTLVLRHTRSKILFRPVEEFERLRGTNLAWFGIDELTYTQEQSWNRLEGRLRDPKATQLCGFAVWTPKGYDWVYRKFIAEPAQGYRAIIAKPFENRFLLERVGDFYEQLRKSYDEKFYEQEVLGSYLSMEGGRVYPAFARNEHVQKLEADAHLPLFWALDFNVDPMSSVIVQIHKQCVRVLDEIVIRHGTTALACQEFLKRYARHSAGVVVYGDASGHAQQTTGASDYEIIREYFQMHSNMQVTYRTPRSNPAVRDRVNVMNLKLRSAGGEIALLVDSKCKELVKDLEQVCYKADSNLVDKDRDRLRTHLSDALGYVVWQECRPAQPVGERGERLF
jgi:hypothetical protein